MGGYKLSHIVLRHSMEKVNGRRKSLHCKGLPIFLLFSFYLAYLLTFSFIPLYRELTLGMVSLSNLTFSKRYLNTIREQGQD
jgi:hypothetical protein